MRTLPAVRMRRTAGKRRLTQPRRPGKRQDSGPRGAPGLHGRLKDLVATGRNRLAVLSPLLLDWRYPSFHPSETILAVSTQSVQ